MFFSFFVHDRFISETLQDIAEPDLLNVATALPRPSHVGSGGAGPHPIVPQFADDIDGLADGLMHLQAVAYANDEHLVSPACDEWSESVLFLKEFLDQRKEGSLVHAAVLVDRITAYPPWQWRSDRYLSEVRDDMKNLIPLLLSDRNFISDSYAVQVLWMWCLNHHVEKRGLLCRFVVQGSNSDVHRIRFQAQGRVKSTKFRKVSYAQYSRDYDLLDELGN